MMCSAEMTSEMQVANRNAMSARGFELEARGMASLMRDKFDLAFIDVGGWDTHVNDGGAEGKLATLLSNLGQGLSASPRRSPGVVQHRGSDHLGVRPRLPRERQRVGLITATARCTGCSAAAFAADASPAARWRSSDRR
jgi:hypothetical protein